jgi:radical SAM protein (TIGR01212 family)
MGFTCPNIDGTVARGGCVFCENESFSPNLGVVHPPKRFRLHLESKENPFLEEQLAQLEAQVIETRSKLAHKFNAEKFLVYFQSFTNTYAPLETLKVLYEKALSLKGVVGISVGTRTDAITEETLDYLATLAERHEVWIEFGVQSCYEETLEKINRGHTFANTVEWIRKAKARGLHVCGHLIFGLPDETPRMMLTSLEATLDSGVNALKIHPLYVTKRTLLAQQYAKGAFVPMEETAYIDTLIQALKIIPDTVVVQRITAGVDDDSLLAPQWCGNLKQQRKHIRLALEKAGLVY